MAKQRRAPSRPGTSKTSRPGALARTPPPEKLVNRPIQVGPVRPPAPVRRTSYVEAIARYEKGFEALQRREYSRAGELFRSLLTDYPEEKELHERVRLYINICDREAAPREASPKSLDERVYAATLALNAGRYDAAVEHLRVVLDAEPSHDHAEYMLAVVDSARGRPADALSHLRRALELNPDNRALALQDPDLEALRTDEGFRAAIDIAGARGDRRKLAKLRGIR
jgi:tetratricopeptide (TPR) repeat protein